MNKSPHVVVLTATVTPAPSMPGTLRADPVIRLNDYIEAFKFYLSLPHWAVDRIVFLENSGANLKIFQTLADEAECQKYVECISVSSVYDATKGKGYGEFLMLDAGLLESKLCSAGAKIWKITGRLKVKNLSSLIKSAPDSYDVYCDLRDVPLIGDKLGGNKWMDLRQFSFNMNGYNKFFRGRYNENYLLEKSFFELLSKSVENKNELIVPRFKVQPSLGGFSGHSNKDYSGFAHRAKDLMRTISRTLAPNLWI